MACLGRFAVVKGVPDPPVRRPRPGRETLALRVDQRVERIEEERTDTSEGAAGSCGLPRGCIENRHDDALGLATAGAGGDNGRPYV